jgi:di/tricarboxylate transporter
MSGRTMLVVGFLLIFLGGVVLPFLMVLHIIESTFFLVFLSFTSSTIGLFLGLIGASEFVRKR